MKTKIPSLRATVQRIVAEAFEDAPETTRSPVSDPSPAENVSDGLLEALLRALDSDEFVGTAHELSAGVPRGKQHDKLAPARYEDVEDLAIASVQKVLRDPQLHDALRGVAESMLRGLM